MVSTKVNYVVTSRLTLFWLYNQIWNEPPYTGGIKILEFGYWEASCFFFSV